MLNGLGEPVGVNVVPVADAATVSFCLVLILISFGLHVSRLQDEELTNQLALLV